MLETSEAFQLFIDQLFTKRMISIENDDKGVTCASSKDLSFFLRIWAR